MPTQILQRTLGNIVLGGVNQMIVDRAANPVAAEALSSGGMLGLGVVGKIVQYTVYRGRRKPWLDLGADTFASSGGTIGGEVVGGLLDTILLKAPVETTTTTPTTTTTTTSGTSTGSGSSSASSTSGTTTTDTYDSDNDLENSMDQDS